MKQFFKQHSLYFSILLLFLIIISVELLQLEKGDGILFFCENRSPFADLFFTYITKMGEEPIYAITVIIMLFIRYRYALLIPIAGFTVMGLSYALKSYFATPRPKVYFWELKRLDELNFVEGVDAYMGLTSFPSGHTMSAFVLYGLLAFCIPNRLWGLFCIIMAILVGISRIYLVQHFLEDVLAGALIGTLLAIAFFFIQKQLSNEPNRWWNKSFLKR